MNVTINHKFVLNLPQQLIYILSFAQEMILYILQITHFLDICPDTSSRIYNLLYDMQKEVFFSTKTD